MIERALKELNPVRDERGAIDPARMGADLERILALPRDTAAVRRPVPHHAHGRRLAVIAVASCLALLAVLGLPFMPWRSAAPAYAATPPLLAGELAAGVGGEQARGALLRIAAAAERSTEPARLGSDYSTWSIGVRVHGGEPVRSAVVPLDVTFTIQPDLSGSLRSVFAEPVAGDASADDVPEAGTIQNLTTYPPGQAVVTFPRDLSTDPARLEGQLGESRPIATNGPAELFVAVTDLAREQTPSAGVRGAICRLLARADGIVAIGTLRDRAGRSGLGFAVTSDMSGLPTRYVLVLDPSSGRLLASEQMLTTNAGKLDVPVPSVVDYTVFR